ncbi:MAG: hypothetical protein HUU57_11655 [Bdellovibrio sp.]|nr:hypothetical protein [Bdellovibrio sp.]
MKWRSLGSAYEGEYNAKVVDVSKQGPLGCCVLQGFFAPPGKVHSRAYTKHRDLLYDVHFTFDQRSRRITPEVSHARNALLAFGDSYTLGEGVNDEESFPYVLGTYRASTQVYNLGLMGGSANQTLYEVTKLPEKRLPDLPDQEVTAIYTFMVDHLERLICRSLCLTAQGMWRLNQPFYSLKNGRPYFEGAFSDRKVLNSFYTWFHQSAIVQGTGMVLPPQFTQEHFDFFATMMVEIRDVLKTKYPKLKFYVVMYPGSSDPYGSDLTAACKKRGLNVLNYASVDITGLAQKRERIAGEGHPSPIAHMILARLLNRDLPQ